MIVEHDFFAISEKQCLVLNLFQDKFIAGKNKPLFKKEKGKQRKAQFIVDLNWLLHIESENYQQMILLIPG